MTNLAQIQRFFSQDRPRVGTVLVGLLLIIAGFWLYNNFTQTEGLVNQETISVEPATAEAEKSGGQIAGEAIGPGLGGGTETSNWVARDISRDSLKDQKSYTVQAGDTLWEIAEGRFGSGFDWHKILAANKDKVGFLPDGSQALIQVGTVLSLPQ